MRESILISRDEFPYSSVLVKEGRYFLIIYNQYLL